MMIPVIIDATDIVGEGQGGVGEGVHVKALKTSRESPSMIKSWMPTSFAN